MFDGLLRWTTDSPPARPLTWDDLREFARRIADEPLRPDPPELRHPDEVRWRKARPGATHHDYLLATNPALRRKRNNYWRAQARSRRNQPSHR